MHGLGEYPLLLKIQALRYSPCQALALGLSLLAHCGLVVVIFFGGVVGSEHAGLTASTPVGRVMIVDMGAKDATSSVVQDIDETERRPISVADNVAHLRSPQYNQQTSKEDSIFPLLVAVKPYYFAIKDLTQRPLVVRDVPADFMLIVPDVPSQAATLQILISEYGDVDKVIVENSLLPEVAQKTVIDEFSKLKFNPGEVKGIPVKSQLRIEIMLEEIDGEK